MQRLQIQRQTGTPTLSQTTIALAALLAAAGAQAEALPAAPASPASAAHAPPTPQESELPAVTVRAAADSGVVATKASASTTKSGAPLFETPQSVSVLTRAQMDERGVQSLADALQSVAGVVSGNYGRRGWDDFIIRGVRATESVYLDGLKQGSDTWIAQELFGAESVEVLKGPASVNFGLVQPGGMVNLVSKRPRTESFSEVGFTLGNYGMKQATVDLGRPLSTEGGKAAWRLNALVSDSDDPTQHVYFKKRWLAPSLTLDLGPDTDLTLLASYQNREYIRQQGLSPYGTLLDNPNGELDRSLFAGEPGFGPYRAWAASMGWALEHRFASGWTLRQNVRAQRFDVDGLAVFHNTLAADRRTQARTGRIQDIPGHSLMADQSLQRDFTTGPLQHSLMAGLDLRRDIIRLASTTCTVPALDLYNPVYGVTVTCPATPNADDTSNIVDVGLYLRDRIRLLDKLTLSLAARHDRVRNTATNHLTGTELTQRPSKTTGNAGLMYQVTPGVAPYASVANSFYPVEGTNFDGLQFTPETGQQVEVGVKLQSDGGRVQGALAVYDLKRRNVTTADPVNTGYSVQTGEQRAKGFEAELNADLDGGWTLSAAYSYSDTELTKDNTASRVGKRLDNVPRHAVNAQVGHRFTSAALHGWSTTAGLRHESDKRGYSFDYVVPAYTVFDAGLAYQARHWRAGLTVKNLFDKDYYAGGLNNNVLPLGTPRQILMNVVFEL